MRQSKLRAGALLIAAVLTFPALLGAATRGPSGPGLLAQSTVTHEPRVALVRFERGGDHDFGHFRDHDFGHFGFGFGLGFGHPYYWNGWWPYYGPYDYGYPGYYGYSYRAQMGEVKLKVEPHNTQVYVNGSYAGEAGQLKTLWLAPGSYNLEFKANQHTIQDQVYVLAGKTLKIDVNLKDAATMHTG